MTQSIDPFCEEGSELERAHRQMAGGSRLPRNEVTMPNTMTRQPHAVDKVLAGTEANLPLTDHGAEVGVDSVNGLVIHENCAEWHPWDPTIYEESE